MRQRLRIQVRPRWEQDGAVEASPWKPAQPTPKLFKLLAGAGIGAFWLYFFGLLGTGGHAGNEQGFLLFLAGQMPLAWHWLRQNTRRHR